MEESSTNPRDFLTEYQATLLTNFQEIIQVQDDQLCIDLLQRTGWNVEQAVNAFMQGGVPSPTSSRRQTTSSSSSAATQEIPRPTNPRSSNRVLPAASFDVNNAETDNATDQGRGGGGGGGLLDLILYPIRWMFSARSLTISPNRDVDTFIQEFEASYGRDHLPFHRGSYQSAVAAAFQQNKFLLIYLHSPLHEDNDQFCGQVLSHPSVMGLVNESMVVWGGRVWDPEAYGLASQLSVTSYPFLALVLCQSARTVQVADRIQGLLEVDGLVGRLRNVVGIYGAIIERNRLEAERRAEAIRLREQQDREYQESVEEERREIERQRREEEERQRLEEEKKQQEELAAAVELSKKLSREDALRKIRAAFAANPEPENGPEITTIRFQLPRAKKLTYRFHKNDKAQRIYDYLRLQFAEEGDLTVNFTMSTTFPKMEINDLDKTIAELGLHPKGMLYVQDADL